MRYVMWIAEFRESSNLWTHIALSGTLESMPVSASCELTRPPLTREIGSGPCRFFSKTFFWIKHARLKFNCGGEVFRVIFTLPWHKKRRHSWPLGHLSLNFFVGPRTFRDHWVVKSSKTNFFLNLDLKSGRITRWT